ncbi:MAG TPA: O-antigen ligase family protein [Flavobacteriales bacterium]|nr:O-antigen ligase family protein [Flavobacteriales bacterium]HPH81083.1 O-antigen ligase family protein [Flavobacteriales bacterium]
MNWKEIIAQPLLILTLLLAAVLPLSQPLIPLVIVLLLAFYSWKGHWKFSWDLVRSSPEILALLGFYVYNVLGLIGTENYSKGFIHLEIKLSLFLLPWLIFARSDLNLSKKKLINQTFIGACLIYCIWLLGRSTFIYITKGQNEFSYELFSNGFHPSYLAMYLLLAIRLCYAEIQSIQTKLIIPYLLIIAVFVSCIVLLSSKINLFLLVFSFLYFFVEGFIRAKRKTYWIYTAAAFIGIIAVSVFYNPSISERAERSFQVFSNLNTVDKSDTESNAARILIWQSAWTLMKEHPMGVGVGDVNIELENQYRLDGFTGIESKKLNAHNQFLQTGVALGFPGLISLLLLFILPIISRNKRQSGILMYFLVICFVNALVEGILETQKGVVFFGFFYCLLLKEDERI